MKSTQLAIGKTVFLLGVVLAILAALIPQLDVYKNTILWTLIGAGFLVGLLNITPREETQFLVAVIAILLVSNSLGKLAELGWLSGLLSYVDAFVVPAGLLVALKSVWDLGRKR
ncbi:MAG: hypothetical protein AABX39_04385 [Nanoarchaeota archaeon]